MNAPALALLNGLLLELLIVGEKEGVAVQAARGVEQCREVVLQLRLEVWTSPDECLLVHCKDEGARAAHWPSQVLGVASDGLQQHLVWKSSSSSCPAGA